MYILVSESFHIRLTGRSLLHPVKVKWRFRYKPEWFRERWNSLCKPHHHPPPSISYHLPYYGAGLKLTTQGKPVSEILPLESCLLQMRSLKYRTSAESFPWESVLIFSLQGVWGLGGGGGGGFWLESHGFQKGMERGFVCANSWGGEGSSTIYSDTTKFLQPAPLLFTSSKKHSSSWDKKRQHLHHHWYHNLDRPAILWVWDHTWNSQSPPFLPRRLEKV